MWGWRPDSLTNRSYVWQSLPQGVGFFVFFQKLVGQTECGQPPPACGRRVVHTGECRDPCLLWLFDLFSSSSPQGPPEAPGWAISMVQPPLLRFVFVDALPQRAVYRFRGSYRIDV